MNYLDHWLSFDETKHIGNKEYFAQRRNPVALSETHLFFSRLFTMALTASLYFMLFFAFFTSSLLGSVQVLAMSPGYSPTVSFIVLITAFFGLGLLSIKAAQRVSFYCAFNLNLCLSEILQRIKKQPNNHA